jgi:tape measure domain-containing protein
VPDSLVRVQLQATGADQILATLRAVRQEVALLGQQSARINLAANTTVVNQQLGQVTTQLTRINAITARARVDVDTSQAESRLSGLESKVSSLMTGTLAAAGAIIGVQITRGIGAATDAIVGFNSTLEQTRIAFTSLFGSASRANDFMAQLQDFAKKTPFDFEAVNHYAQRLLAVGFAAKDVIPDLTAMGNAVAAAGGNSETLDRVTLALGQMHGSVKLTAQDMNQLIQANIPAWRLLADQIGVTEAQARKMADAGKISGADASAAIIAAMSQQNVGLMDQMSKTFAGRLENLKDTFRSEMADLGKPLFEELSKAVDLASEALASPKFKQAALDMVNDLTAITRAAESVGTAFGKIPPGVSSFLEGALAPGHALIGAIKSLGAGPNLPGMTVPEPPAAAGEAPGGGAALLQQRAATGIMTDLTNQVRTGAMTADQARQQWRALSETFGGLFGNASDLSRLFSGELNQAIADHITQVNDATAAHERLQDTLKQAGQAQALGASSEDVGRAIFGITGTGAQATPEQIQRAKQDIQDLTTAYQRAASVIGTVDLAHGIAGFAAVAPDLARARDSLRDLGQSNQALDNLASLATQFKSLTDATDAATTAYRGFMLTLTETDQKIQQLSTFRGQVTAAVSDADRRRSLGIATPEDLTLLANYKNILANIDTMKTGLQRNATGDILGIAANYPDLKKSDDTLRDMIGKLGGPQQLEIDVKTNTDKALEQINDLLTKPHQATIDVQIATHLTGLPPALANIIASAAGAQAVGGASDGGYARPTTQRLVGGGPYGSGTLYQPGGAIGSAGGGGAGWNQFQPLSQAQYGGIVSSGPLANPQVYAGVMAAAQEYNVDPRALLAFVKNEGVAPSLAAVNNFGGIKGKGGPAAPANEGGTYAAYSSPADFFRSLAANLTTGAYAGDYQSGNLAAVRQRYVAGSATPSAAQQANIANTVSSYNDLVQQYPSGAGGVITPQVPGSSTLTSRVSLTQPTPIQAGAGQTVTPNQVAAMRKRANELAGSAYVYGGGHSSQDAGGFDCSGYVIEVLRAGGINAPFTDAGGLYKWAQTAEGSKLLDAAGIQLGFYNPGAGGMNEHVGINIGGDWFESGGQRGDTAGPSPNAAKGLNKFVGTPHAVAAATGGGIALAQSTGGGTSDLTGAAGGGDLASIISGAATTAGRAGAGAIQGAGIGKTLASLNPQDAQNTLAAYQQILPMLREAANMKYPELPVTAENEALQQGLGFLQAWGQAQGDIRTGASGFADDMQRVTDIIGGPLGAAYGRILQAQYQSARINEQIVSTQSAITQLDTAHQATVDQRTAADRASGRQQTMQGWADQASDQARQRRQQAGAQGIQDAQSAENRGYTGVTRSFQDRQRALQFSQQVQGTDLQNQLADLQQQQTRTGYQRTAQEQLVSAQVKGAGTNEAAAQLAANLAAMHDRDLLQKDADTKAIDDLQEKIRLQQKQANLDSYNLETEQIQAQRAHEDRMAQLDDQATAQQRNAQAEDEAIQESRTARDQAHQMELWQVEDSRAAEDAAYQQQKASLEERLTGLQAEKQAQDDLITTLQQMIGLMGQFGDAGQTALSQLVSGTQGMLTGESKASHPTGGWIPKLAAGGTVPIGGQAFVGESGIEHLLMTPKGAVVTPMGSAPAASGGGVVVNIGTINGGMSEDQIADVTQQFNQALRDAVRKAGTASRAQSRALGR